MSTSTMPRPQIRTVSEPDCDKLYRSLKCILRRMRHGSVLITVANGDIVFVEPKLKLKLDELELEETLRAA